MKRLADMSLLHTRDSENMRFPETTMKGHARWRQARGTKVLHRHDTYWAEVSRGFYQGLHWMARMTKEQASRPTLLCWGFRTTLDEKSALSANASMPVHLISDINHYSQESLNSRQKNKLRNCHKQVEIVEITGPDPLLEQGYPVYLSAVQRTGYGSVITLQRYQEDMRNYFQLPGGMIVAGLIEGRLAGYITAYAVDSTAYIEDVFIHTAALKSNISLGLFYALARACRESPRVRELVHGLHAPENEGLCRHKEDLGFTVVKVPSRIWFMPPSQALVRKLRPGAYYRLTGRKEGVESCLTQRKLASSKH